MILTAESVVLTDCPPDQESESQSKSSEDDSELIQENQARDQVRQESTKTNDDDSMRSGV